MQIEFDVDGQRLIRTSEAYIIEGSEFFVECLFSFSSDWDELEKWAIFKRGTDTYEILIVGNRCIVPVECTAVEGEFTISLIGRQSNMFIIATTSEKLLYVRSTSHSNISYFDKAMAYIKEKAEAAAAVLKSVLEAKDHIDQTDYKIYVGETAPTEDITNAMVWINPAEDDNGSDELAEAVTAAQSAANLAEVQANSVKKYKALWFNSVASMKAEPSLTAGAYVNTAGYYEPNDGGGASYLIREKLEADVADDGSLHELANGLVAELIVENGTVCPEQFGAKGDGISDDADAIQKALNMMEIVSFTKAYNVTKQLYSNGSNLISNNMALLNLQINGDGYGLVLQQDNTFVKGLNIINNASNGYNAIEVKAHNCVIDNCTLVGKNNGGIGVCNLIKNTTIKQCKFKDFAYMIYLKGSINNTIRGCHFTGGSSETDGCGIKITSEPTLGYGSDVSGAHKNIITDNIFENCVQDGIDMYIDGSESIIDNNIFIDYGVCGIEIKTVYRDAPSSGTGGSSLESIRQDTDIIISNNYFHESDVLNHSTNGTIRIANSENREGYTLNCENGVKRVVICNNNFNDVARAFYFYAARNIKFNCNIIHGARTGSYIGELCKYINICNNHFIDTLNLSNGVETPTYDLNAPALFCENINICGNIASCEVSGPNNSIAPFRLRGENILFSNNIVNNFGTAITVKGKMVNINNNLLSSAQGAVVQASDGIVFCNNTFKQSAKGVYFSEAGSKTIYLNGNVYVNMSQHFSGGSNASNIIEANSQDFSL